LEAVFTTNYLTVTTCNKENSTGKQNSTNKTEEENVETKYNPLLANNAKYSKTNYSTSVTDYNT